METEEKLKLTASNQEQGKQLKKQQSKDDKKRNNKKQDSDSDNEQEIPPVVVGRVIDESEIGRFVDLGLGRGVDATKPSPWLSKSSFQVREVTFDNIIGTEEGGLVNNFEKVVESVQQLQTNMSASVPASQQVSVGVDAELSRSHSKTKRSVGTKVLTRTISFRADFDDICVRRGKKKKKLMAGKGSTEQRHTAPQRSLTLPEGDVAKAEVEANLHSSGEDSSHKPTFEERLSKWILDHLKLKSGKLSAKLEEEGDIDDVNPVDKMIALTDSNDVKIRDLRPLCHDFVVATCITHYVCAIELGASEYKMMSEEQVQTRIKMTGKVGVSSAASVSASQQASISKKNKEKSTTKIGTIRERRKRGRYWVERGTCEEAVVGVKFQPLSSVVVRCNVLKKALENALQGYIDSQGVAKYGPFYISCHSEQLFFKIQDNKIVVTDDLSKADEFFVVPCEESGHSRYFSIFYNSESKLKQPDAKIRSKMHIKPIPRYLCCTSVNFRGISDGPLELKLNAKESKSMLTLQDRRSKYLRPAELTDWINEKEIYYINCKHRTFKKDSYICVAATTRQARTSGEIDTVEGEGEVSAAETSKKRSAGASSGDGAATSTTGAVARRKAYSYTTCCKPSISAHDDCSTFMLFRLIRVKKNINWDKFDEPTAEGGEKEEWKKREKC